MRPSDGNEEPPADVSSQNAEEPSAPQADTGGMSKRGESDDKSKSQGEEGSSTEGSQATGSPGSAG